MPTTYRCRLFEIDNDAPPDAKPRELPQFTVHVKSADHAKREARDYLRKRGRFVRGVSITHNRNELACYVFKRKPKDRATATAGFELPGKG